MKEMTIEEIHAVALDIMKEIHEFCVTNDIQYSLAYGSLIGAIRHQGFIPWDDDIDVWMTRPNFEKFNKIFVSRKGYRLSSEYDSDSLICFNRVYETEKSYLKRSIKSCEGNVGVWVDIMPIDGVTDDVSLRNKHFNVFCDKIEKLTKARFWLNYIDNSTGFRKMYGQLRLSLLNLQSGSYKSIHKKMVAESQMYEYGIGKYCCFFQCNAAFVKRKQELLLVESFKSYKQTKFEDTEMMIIDDYDKLLTYIYGDYMKLPPEKDRKFHHGDVFWR